MKRGPQLIKLEINPSNQLIFPVPDIREGARFLSGHAIVSPPRLHGQQPKLVGIALIFDSEHAAPPDPRVIVVLPPDGWIDQDGAEVLGTVVNPLDGMPMVIYSVPEAAVRRVPLVEDDGAPVRSARPILDVPTAPLSDLVESNDLPPISGEIDAAEPEDTVH